MNTLNPLIAPLGLAGVVVDTTAVSKVVQETNSLTYRGYPVQELAAKRNFEDVAYLIWNGELPTEEQLAEALDAFGAPFVVKDDGLAAGKGVVVSADRSVARAHAASLLDDGHPVLLESWS